VKYLAILIWVILMAIGTYGAVTDRHVKTTSVLVPIIATLVATLIAIVTISWWNYFC